MKTPTHLIPVWPLSHPKAHMSPFLPHSALKAHMRLTSALSIRAGITWPLSVAAIAMLAILTASCRTSRATAKEQTRDSYHADTTQHVSALLDSVYIFRDRSTERRGDTVVILDRQTEYRYRLHTDTLHHRTIEYLHDTLRLTTTATSSTTRSPRWLPRLPRSRLLILLTSVILLSVILLIFWIRHKRK